MDEGYKQIGKNASQGGKSMNYDVIIIGAGPGGIFAHMN